MRPRRGTAGAAAAAAAAALLFAGQGAGLVRADTAAVGTILEFDGCYLEGDWYAYQPGVVLNTSVITCAQRCYDDGFPYAGMRTIVQTDGTPNESGCECGCGVGGLVAVASGLCAAPCTTSSTEIFDFHCPSVDGYMSLFTIATEDPFCTINQICEDATDLQIRQECEEQAQNLTVTYAVVISVLGVLVIAGAVYCVARRRKYCRERRGPSQSMKRQILQDQLIGHISTESLVHQVNQSWVIDFHNITLGKMIAAGSSGQVYAGVFDGKPVAVKELFSVLFDPESLKDFKDEATMLASLHHPHIVRFFGVATCATDRGPAYYLITELKEQSLRQYMNSNAQPDRLAILRMAAEVLSAIDFLHSRRVVHRDLKPENVLLDQFLSVFLCDFGIAKQIDGNNKRSVDMTSDMGTAAYMAPELASSKLLDDIDDTDLVMEGSFARQDGAAAQAAGARPAKGKAGEAYRVVSEGVELGDMSGSGGGGGVMSPSARTLLEADKKEKHFRKVGKKHVISMDEGSKVDVFAFGMLFYAMCAWKPPFCGHRPLQILAFITLQHRRPSLSSVSKQFPAAVLGIISAAWAHDPNDRPSTDELKGRLSKCRAELVNGEGPKLLH